MDESREGSWNLFANNYLFNHQMLSFPLFLLGNFVVKNLYNISRRFLKSY